VLDVSRLNALGWKASIGLREGIESTYAWYLENHEQFVRGLEPAAAH
jgi:GDP-L-fucose synthase